MRIRFSHLLVALLATLAIGVVMPAAATAQAGEQESAYDEYIEHVPSAGGDKPSDDVIEDVAGGRGDPLPPNAAGALAALGPDGERAAAVAEAFVPAPGGGSGAAGEPARGQGPPAEAGATSPPEGEAGAEAALGALLDPDAAGLGPALPLILAGTLVAGLAFALRRRLHRSGPPA
jgi:hypothetical protein